MKTHKFSLVELLVIIAVLAILLSMLSPSLKGVVKKSYDLECHHKLRTWSSLCNFYTDDNNGYYMPEQYQASSWMDQLEDLYESQVSARLCPEATYPSQDIYGNTNQYWTWGRLNSGKIGSYGLNHWINSIPYGRGWRGRIDYQWQSINQLTQANNIPIFSDCAWYGGNPSDGRGDGLNIVSSKPAPSADWNLVNPRQWRWDMARYQLDRHNRAINSSFADGSARKVFLDELWNLKWHAGFKTSDSPPDFNDTVPWFY